MEQIKRHHFFYGVDWEVIRRIDAPFVPSLRSITDTSYFPTDELDQVLDIPVVDPNAASKDLAFLGFVLDILLRHWCIYSLAWNSDILSSDFRRLPLHSNF